MRTHIVVVLLIVGLFLAGVPGNGPPDVALQNRQYVLAQVADLRFTADIVNVTVEQGGTNTGLIRVENFGGEAGSANLTYLGDPGALTGMTIEIATLEVNDLAAGSYQDIIVTVSAAAGLLPLGPRRLDMALMNGTTELDTMHLDMYVVAPATTNTGGGSFLGLTPEMMLISIAATVCVIGAVIAIRRR